MSPSLLIASDCHVEKYIKTSDGLSIWTESFGNPNDSAVLLIMGAMNQGIFWPDEFCAKLADAGFYVIRYDHRDTGKSDGVDFFKRPYDLDRMAMDAYSVISTYKLQKVNVVGLSMGGYIAQLLAINYPDKINGLILISTSADHRPYMQATMRRGEEDFFLPAPGDDFIEYVKNSASNPPKTEHETEENMIEGWKVTYGGKRPFPREKIVQALKSSSDRSSPGITPINHALAVSASPHRLDAVKRIVAPTLVLHGKQDRCLPLAHGTYLAQHIPNAHMETLDMGHTFQWSWDEEILSNIIGFIRGL